MYTVQTPGKNQLFIQAKAFRDRRMGFGGRQEGELGVGGWLSETRGSRAETNGAGGEYIQDYSNIESVSYRNRKCR